jgi:predicted molibdopterin-dependent oxidoreductase YjgC
MNEQQLVLNSKTITFRSGHTILEVAHEKGVHIPTFCYLKHTTPTGVVTRLQQPCPKEAAFQIRRPH